jgi:hypothetical protein
MPLERAAGPQLAELTGLDPEGAELPAELRSERADVAWLIADTFGPVSHFDLGRERFPFDFRQSRPVRDRRVGGILSVCRLLPLLSSCTARLPISRSRT